MAATFALSAAPAPAETELAREFGVSRPTLREALRLLAGSHLIRVQQGRAGGIFVSNTASESMGRGVSDAIAGMLATQSVSLHDLLETRVYLEVRSPGWRPSARLARPWRTSRRQSLRPRGATRRRRGSGSLTPASTR